jgi:hypothetical protein
MKQEHTKQARADDSGGAVNNQTKKREGEGAESGESPSARFSEALDCIEREFKESLAEAESDHERMRLLSVRQWMPELRASGQALIEMATPGQPGIHSQTEKSLKLNFLDLENAVNSALGMLYLLSECLVPMVDNQLGANSGCIAAGIGSQADDCASFLRSRFGELHDEYRRASGVKGGAQ